MSNGTWIPGEGKERTGLFNWFVSMANYRVSGTKKGIVGIPIKADWGPDNVLVPCEDAGTLENTFGVGGTAYLAQRAFSGSKKYKPYRVITYRMASTTAEYAVAIISECIKLTAKYKGNRGNDFKVSVSDNIVSSGQKDICIYEGSTMLKRYTVKPDDIDNIVNTINNDSESHIDAIKVKDGMISDVSTLNFAGGDSGFNVTVNDYLKALAAFETIYLNTLSLDGVTDESFLTTVKSWHKRVWDAGKMVQIVIGGTHEDDKSPNTGNLRSKNCDHFGLINLIVGGIDSTGNIYSSAEMAPQIAGAIAALPLNKALTYKELEDIVDITVNLSDTEIGVATNAGSLVFFKDINPETFETTVRVERGINTFTSISAEKGEKLRKIKAISTMAAIDYDTGRYALQNVIGELDNNDDGKAALLSGIKQYLETLVKDNVISDDILINLSESMSSDGDMVYLETQAFTIDKIEQIFNKIYL